MAAHPPKNPRFAEAVRESFEQQKIMGLLGARLAKVEPGHVEIELPFRGDLVQQDGFVHAGVLVTIADSCGGYAALSLLPAGYRVLASEFKLHFLEPAKGERFVAKGRVVRAGRTLTVCEIEADAVDGARTRRCVWGSQTIVNLGPKG